MGRRVSWPGDSCGGGGLHRLAVRVPGARALGRDRALGRAGGNERAPGSKRRAKTDRTDAKWLSELLFQGRLPEAWLPPEHVRQWRSRARLRNTLVAERTSWTQRIRATLYHHGVAGAPDELRTLAGRRFLAGLELPLDAHERITTALEIIDLLDASSPNSSATCAHSRAARPAARR